MVMNQNFIRLRLEVGYKQLPEIWACATYCINNFNKSLFNVFYSKEGCT